MSNLPKPFCAQNVTTSNANEVTTNFMAKNGVNISDTGNESKNIENYLKEYFKDHLGEDVTPQKIDKMVERARKSGHGDVQRLITEKDIGSVFMPFKYRISDAVHSNSVSSEIKEDMIKQGYTFTSISDKKFKEAVNEIYVRTTVGIDD